MVYITGDLHGDLEDFYLRTRTLHPGDILIVAGDFGFIWHTEEAGKQLDAEKLDQISAAGIQVLFLDGNHECFSVLEEYPQTQLYGASVHAIRENIFHLQRGRIYEIEGNSFFVFGGAYSIDKWMRTENLSWWARELPSNEEYSIASQALTLAQFQVDFILTHTAPRDIIRKLGYAPDMHDAELTGYLEWIEYEATFRHWYFGHFHEDREIGEKFTAAYKKIYKI